MRSARTARFPRICIARTCGRGVAAMIEPNNPILSKKQEKAEEKAAKHDWAEQYMIRNKLRLIAEDARTYEQDTGVHALNIGFPVISLPPGVFGGRQGVGS